MKPTRTALAVWRTAVVAIASLMAAVIVAHEVADPVAPADAPDVATAGERIDDPLR